MDLERFGFGVGIGSVHLARTIMFSELGQLLDYVSVADSSRDAFSNAIEKENCLGKRSDKSRVLTKRHLSQLYSLDPNTTVFKALQYFWQRDVDARPLLACLCAYVRDPIFRVSAQFVFRLDEGQAYSRQSLEQFLEDIFPDRFSKAMLKSAAQNLASSWVQTGHLTGKVKKYRVRAKATPASTSYALFLGFLRGKRGASLFQTEYMRLLDCPMEESINITETASRKGLIVLNRISSVLEVSFPNLLTRQEMEWVNEQD